jgi:hypothetical protein
MAADFGNSRARLLSVPLHQTPGDQVGGLYFFIHCSMAVCTEKTDAARRSFPGDSTTKCQQAQIG